MQGQDSESTSRMTHGSTDDFKTPNAQRLLPSYPFSVERDWDRIEIDEEPTSLDDTDYGDIDTDPPSTCVGDQYVNQTSRVSCPLLIT